MYPTPSPSRILDLPLNSIMKMKIVRGGGRGGGKNPSKGFRDKGDMAPLVL